MNRSGLLLVSALALGGYAQVAASDTGGDNWSLSGWLNEGLTCVWQGQRAAPLQPRPDLLLLDGKG